MLRSNNEHTITKKPQLLEYVQDAWQCEQEVPTTTERQGRPTGQPIRTRTRTNTRSRDEATKTATRRNCDHVTTQSLEYVQSAWQCAKGVRTTTQRQGRPDGQPSVAKETVKHGHTMGRLEQQPNKMATKDNTMIGVYTECVAVRTRCTDDHAEKRATGRATQGRIR